MIEKEKERLLQEHEDILKTYYLKGYFKSMSTIKK
jgi:hypothetical protein